jgi:hypothetical protein
MTMRTALATIAAALIAAPALADHTHIVIEDGVFIPSLRGSFDIWPRGEEPSAPHTGHAVEIGLTGASGKDRQTRSAGDPPLTFGGQSFGAPATVSYEFDFGYFELLYRYRHFFGAARTFGIEGVAGLGSASMDITASTATQSAREELRSGGLVFGGGVIWKFLPGTSLQSRMTLFGSGEREGVTGAARFDVMVSHAFTRNIALRGGVTSWGLVSERDEDEDASSPNSHLRANFGGLALGLEVMF